jgi:hypothetical protein
MALQRGPQKLGDIIDLRGPRGGMLEVIAPDGLELRIPAAGGRARLWLAQPGTWRMRWEIDDDTSEVEVIDGGAHEPAPPEPEAPAFTYMPGRR